MGEQIALGILKEQALCYPTDPFVLTVPTFDGDVVRIGTHGMLVLERTFKYIPVNCLQLAWRRSTNVIGLPQMTSG